jgi:hypothetical protein
MTNLSRLTILAGMCILLLPATVSGSRRDDEAIRKAGREVVELCAQHKAEVLRGKFDEAMSKALSLEQTTKVLDSVFTPSTPLGERLSDEVNGQSYKAVHKYTDREMVITASFDDKGRVSGLFLSPRLGKAGIPPDPKANYVTKAKLRVPFDDEWWVFWGGTKVEQNYHVAHADQRHAYDIVILKKLATHRGDGKKNEDYYAFGMPILAPADGTIIEAEDGIEDNVPGKMNSRQIYGNHVVIDLGNNEFAVMCHFKKGSVLFKPGDKVKRGQAIALCGNSGNSSEPHLHFHLQDRKQLGLGAISLPAPFSNYVANGKLVKMGEPVRGTLIKPK